MTQHIHKKLGNIGDLIVIVKKSSGNGITAENALEYQLCNKVPLNENL